MHAPGSVLERAMRVAYTHELGIAVSRQRSHFRGVHVRSDASASSLPGAQVAAAE